MAHLVAHKDYNVEQISDELKIVGEIPDFGLSALFTSAFNMAYCPTEVMKPTDYNGEIRRILHQHLVKLYGDRCTMLPKFASFVESTKSGWRLDEFTFGAPIGDLSFIRQFLDFRKKWYGQFE